MAYLTMITSIWQQVPPRDGWKACLRAAIGKPAWVRVHTSRGKKARRTDTIGNTPRRPNTRSSPPRTSPVGSSSVPSRVSKTPIATTVKAIGGSRRTLKSRGPWLAKLVAGLLSKRFLDDMLFVLQCRPISQQREAHQDRLEDERQALIGRREVLWAEIKCMVPATSEESPERAILPQREEKELEAAELTRRIKELTTEWKECEKIRQNGSANIGALQKGLFDFLQDCLEGVHEADFGDRDAVERKCFQKYVWGETEERVKRGEGLSTPPPELEQSRPDQQPEGQPAEQDKRQEVQNDTAQHPPMDEIRRRRDEALHALGKASTLLQSQRTTYKSSRDQHFQGIRPEGFSDNWDPKWSRSDFDRHFLMKGMQLTTNVRQAEQRALDALDEARKANLPPVDYQFLKFPDHPDDGYTGSEMQAMTGHTDPERLKKWRLGLPVFSAEDDPDVEPLVERRGAEVEMGLGVKLNGIVETWESQSCRNESEQLREMLDGRGPQCTKPSWSIEKLSVAAFQSLEPMPDDGMNQFEYQQALDRLRRGELGGLPAAGIRPYQPSNFASYSTLYGNAAPHPPAPTRGGPSGRAGLSNYGTLGRGGAFASGFSGGGLETFGAFGLPPGFRSDFSGGGYGGGFGSPGQVRDADEDGEDQQGVDGEQGWDEGADDFSEHHSQNAGHGALGRGGKFASGFPGGGYSGGVEPLGASGRPPGFLSNFSGGAEVRDAGEDEEDQERMVGEQDWDDGEMTIRDRNA